MQRDKRAGRAYGKVLKKSIRGSVISLFAFVLTLFLTGNSLPVFETIHAQESSNLFSDFFKIPFREHAIPKDSLEVSAESGSTMVVPMGIPIGIKLTTEGVLVTGFSQGKEVDGEAASPAKAAGIEVGDIILYIDDTMVESAEQISDLVKASNGQTLHITLKREGNLRMFDVAPIYSDSAYKIGMYVRNVSAGIGTLTFVNPATQTFAALGHGITDTDTGQNLNLSQGAITNSYILSAQKGQKGQAGELRGIISSDAPNIGAIRQNSDIGIYGQYLDETDADKAVPIAEIDEIQIGPATILTTISGAGVEEYDVEIVKLVKQTQESQKSMVIRVTDPRLLTKTGGIVQGMSGSPILQNGKLVGAVTHVFVNDPTCGYGIFAKWMDEKTKQLQ